MATYKHAWILEICWKTGIDCHLHAKLGSSQSSLGKSCKLQGSRYLLASLIQHAYSHQQLTTDLIYFVYEHQLHAISFVCCYSTTKYKECFQICTT